MTTIILILAFPKFKSKNKKKPPTLAHGLDELAGGGEPQNYSEWLFRPLHIPRIFAG